MEVDVPEGVDVGEDSKVRTLESEVRALRQRVELREQSLRVLNRRLLQLESSENGVQGFERIQAGLTVSENETLRADNASLREQLERARAELDTALQRQHQLEEELAMMRDTKTFRWSLPARDVYSKLRRLR
jgi:chromosome segregation ATPase